MRTTVKGKHWEVKIDLPGRRWTAAKKGWRRKTKRERERRNRTKPSETVKNDRYSYVPYQ